MGLMKYRMRYNLIKEIKLGNLIKPGFFYDIDNLYFCTNDLSQPYRQHDHPKHLRLHGQTRGQHHRAMGAEVASCQNHNSSGIW